MMTNVPAVREQKPAIEVGNRGLLLRNLDDMYRFAQYVCASGFAPKELQKPEAVLVAIEFGLELGLSPVQSLQNVAVINGRPTLLGDTMLALCMSSDAWNSEVFHEWFEGQAGSDDFRAVCRVGRRGRAEPVERSFSVAQAKRAGLWGKPGPWSTFPERMLQMRARSWALRDAFPDILRGLLSAEEAMDLASYTSRASASPEPQGVAGLAAKLGVDTQQAEARRDDSSAEGDGTPAAAESDNLWSTLA